VYIGMDHFARAGDELALAQRLPPQRAAKPQRRRPRPRQ